MLLLSAIFLCFMLAADLVNSFNVTPVTPLTTSAKRRCTHLYSSSSRNGRKIKFGQKTDAEVSRFLTEFKLADGSLVDPYKMLNIKRDASTVEIKQSYRKLSRKLHPDMVAQSNILPGKCQNLDDVREEWERVKFSYEILIDPKIRKSWDRNSSVAKALDDPAGAAGRAILNTSMSGIGMVLGGAWKLGEIATKKVYETATVKNEDDDLVSDANVITSDEKVTSATISNKPEQMKAASNLGGAKAIAASAPAATATTITKVDVGNSFTKTKLPNEWNDMTVLTAQSSIPTAKKSSKKKITRGGKGFGK